MVSSRLLLMRIGLLAAFAAFAIALAYYQLWQGSELRQASEKNHLRWVRSPAPRGVIYDRKGRVLAISAQSLTAWLEPGEVPRKGWDQLYRELVDLGIYPDLAAADRELGDYRRYPGYLPVRLQRDLRIGTVARLEERLAFLPGVYLKTEPVRLYPEGPLSAHVLGYLREIDPDELKKREGEGYRPGDRIGRSGLEKVFEADLRGVEGGEQVEVDAGGRVLRTLQTVRPQPGTPLTLTLDLDLQRAAEEGLKGRPGAVVALDPTTGDILALASAPAYDLNLMSGRIFPQVFAWLRGPQRPELNRATAGLYPPGSVFKIVTAAAALERGVIRSSYQCTGVYHGIHCWKHDGHGWVDLTEAVAQSCNVAFMKMAEQTGIASLSKMGRRFGLGETSGLNLLSERAGVVPDPLWAHKVYHRRWELGETLQVGIGQSALEITPLQASRIIAAIANGGELARPRLVMSVGDRPQPILKPQSLKLQPATLSRIIRGLDAVVAEGTARSLDPSLHIAGKTGTAQNPRGADHAWFVGYAPAENPKIAVAVLVEHGGHGGATAAPIAESVIRVALEGPPKPTSKEVTR